MINDPNKLEEQRSLIENLIEYYSRTGEYSGDFNTRELTQNKPGGTQLGLTLTPDPEHGDYDVNMSNKFLKMLSQPDALADVTDIERQLRGNRWTGDYDWSPTGYDGGPGYTPKHTDEELIGQQESIITAVNALLGEDENILDVLKKLGK